jgi:hypothetical protein
MFRVPVPGSKLTPVALRYRWNYNHVKRLGSLQNVTRRAKLGMSNNDHGVRCVTLSD